MQETSFITAESLLYVVKVGLGQIACGVIITQAILKLIRIREKCKTPGYAQTDGDRALRHRYATEIAAGICLFFVATFCIA